MGNIVVFGPRASGKTTFLAGLAYWQMRKENLKQKNLFDVQPINDDARTLQDKAENIILNAGQLEPTIVQLEGVTELPSYSFLIRVKQEAINLVVRDYAGEIFEELSLDSPKAEHEEFIEECLRADVSGTMILLSGWQKESDREYLRMLKTFISLIDQKNRLKDYRLAIAMSKCERGELWPGRIEPEIDIFDAHLPLTKAALTEKIPPQNLSFYAVSTFGVLKRNDPRPNRLDEPGTKGKGSVLREPDRWRPYNLIAPLYWLSTGKRISANV